MPRATPILTNFTAGELSPRLAGRIDLAKYYNGCLRLENMIIHPHGGASRRPGTKYVAAVKDHAKKVRLVPFEFSVTQAYMLEFGHEYIRFYMDNGQIQDVDSYTKLLLHCDGEDASQVFTDDGNTGHIVTANGNAQIDDAQKVFGSGSALFDGTGDYLSVADHDDWYMAAGKFTIDFRVRFNTLPGASDGQVFFSQYHDASNYVVGFIYNSAGTYTLNFAIDDAGDVFIITKTWTPVVDTDYHLAFIRGWGGNANDWAITVNGASLGTETDADDWPQLTQPFEIGRQNVVGAYRYVDGWIDEFRVSKGIARWTADFAPPSVAYPLSGEASAYEVTTTYLESELPALKFGQSADVLYITHPDHPPRKLSRTGHTAWTLTEIDFQDGPYDEEVAAQLTTSGPSGQVTITFKGDTIHYLLYDAEVAAFTVGDTLTGTTSTATAEIKAVTDWGTEGILTLRLISGIFQDNEQITDVHAGNATTNGTVGNEFLVYDTEFRGPFTVGYGVRGLTSGATGTLRGLQDDGLTGKMVIEMTSEENFIDNETIKGVKPAFWPTASVKSSTRTHRTPLAGTHYLFYDAEDVVFAAGKVLTGTTSTATAKIMVVDDWGTEGVLTLAAISGTFQDNEDITDSGTGDATVNGTVGNGYIEYDTEADGPFQVGETITGGSSGATGTLRALQDDGATGKMVIEMGANGVDFATAETITGGTSNATASVTVFSKTLGTLFTSDDVGAPFGYFFDDTWTWLEIKSVTDDITAVAIVRGIDIAGSAEGSKYRKGSWKVGNYPHCASFHEQRLLFGATNSRPQTIWGSEAGNPEIFKPGVEDTDAFTYTIAADQVNLIRWLKSSGVLIPGTIGGEWTAMGSGTDEPITATNIWVKPATTYGSANVNPIKIGQAILFLQRQERKLREFVLSPDSVEPVYVAPDMTILAEHITEGGIIYMDYQQEPDSIVWAVRSDGILLGMTYNRPQDVIGWHRHITDGEFESVAVIPGEGENQVWVSVKRTINGGTKRYIEYFTSSLWDDVTDGIYVDSALTYEGAEVTTLTNLDHLEGEEVAILTNKGVHPNQTVSGNEISLDWGVTKAHVGKSYTSVLQTMSLEAGQREGTAQGKIKRIHKATVRLYETLGCEVGPDLDTMDTIPFRMAGDPMDALPPLFTGDKEVGFPGGYTTNAYVFVRQQQPLPLTVLSIIPHMATHDE